jgi:hypothetical protein
MPSQMVNGRFSHQIRRWDGGQPGAKYGQDIVELSGQEYVDVYAQVAKDRLKAEAKAERSGTPVEGSGGSEDGTGDGSGSGTGDGSGSDHAPAA